MMIATRVRVCVRIRVVRVRDYIRGSYSIIDKMIVIIGFS